MNAPKPKPRARQKPAAAPGEKPSIGLPDPLQAAQEEALHAKEGNHKLALAVDALRSALETIVIAEMDYTVKPPQPIGPMQLRTLAIEGLDAYSRLTGQNWRLKRNKPQGSWAGDRSLTTLEE